MNLNEHTAPDSDPLAALRTDAGAFAMVAIDQREALRAMLSEQRLDTVSDDDLTRFKISAAQALSPHASGILVDRQFGLEGVVRSRAVSPGCGLIASGDVFFPAHGELVGEVAVDHGDDLMELKRNGVVALKLLVLYRPDIPGRQRVSQVEDFVRLCREAGMISIIEPVSRKPLNGSEWDPTAGMLAAASELGALGADLYKSEVPFHGNREDDDVRAACRTLTRRISSPWIILSSGVKPGAFPHALALACQEGASGFLAGRAVWAPSLSAADVGADLRTAAVDRLEALVRIADRETAMRPSRTTTVPPITKAEHHA